MSKTTRRTRSYDAAAARTAILDAAEAVFAAEGFDGARVDAIAAASGYNKSLIFQYFGDKLLLYAEVLQRADQAASALRAHVFAPLLEHPQLASDAQQLRAFFERAFHAIFDHFASHPNLLRILLWEMAEGWQSYRQISGQAAEEHSAQLDQLFAQAQQAGLIRSTFAPAVQLTLALQICQTSLAGLPLYTTLQPSAALDTPAGVAALREQVVQMIVSGLLVDQPS